MKQDLEQGAKDASFGLWYKFVDSVKKIPAKYKTLAGVGLFALSSTAAESSTLQNAEKDDTHSEMHTDVSSVVNDDKTITFADATKSLNVKAGDKYKGVNMKFAEMDAPDLGHLFESGMDPYIMGKNSKGVRQYLGLYQMDIGGTMQTFLFGMKDKDKTVWKGVAKDYPKLAALGKTEAARRSSGFTKMFGDLSKTKDFRHKMDEYMRIVKYEPVYEALRQIDGLDFDKRGKVFLGTVMSAANQSPSPKVISAIYKQALARAKAEASKHKRQVTTADIIKQSYEVRKEKWGLKSRYTEECRLALDWQKFEDVMGKIHKEREKHLKKTAELRNSLKEMTPFTPVSTLVAHKPEKIKIAKIPPQMMKKVKEKKGRR